MVHDLRHTAASLAVESGADPKVAQQMLGHRRRQSLDVYTGLFNARLDDVADRLDQAASEAVGVSSVCPRTARTAATAGWGGWWRCR
jgi:Phage integrase family